MSCAICDSYDAAERAALERRDDVAPQTIDGDSRAMCTCRERSIDLLYVSPERFRGSPQVGVPCVMPWSALVAYLSRPSIGEAKDEAGAWSPALYRDGVRRKSNLVTIGALVLDVDEGGDVDEVADVLARYTAVVLETFSSVDDAPRCRAVILLASPVDAETYEMAHAVVRRRLAAASIIVDGAAKDASRLSYSPVRRPGAGYRFRALEGRPLDAAQVAAIARSDGEPPPPAAPPPTSRTGDRYIDAALEREVDAVASAAAGSRNAALNRAVYSLARLHLSDERIEESLLAAAKRAGLGAHESRRTIASALRARRQRAS